MHYCHTFLLLNLLAFNKSAQALAIASKRFPKHLYHNSLRIIDCSCVSDEWYVPIATIPAGARNVKIEEATASENNLGKYGKRIKQNIIHFTFLCVTVSMRKNTYVLLTSTNLKTYRAFWLLKLRHDVCDTILNSDWFLTISFIVAKSRDNGSTPISPFITSYNF